VIAWAGLTVCIYGSYFLAYKVFFLFKEDSEALIKVQPVSFPPIEKKTEMPIPPIGFYLPGKVR
jgi:hypothetical protein